MGEGLSAVSLVGGGGASKRGATHSIHKSECAYTTQYTLVGLTPEDSDAFTKETGLTTATRVWWHTPVIPALGVQAGIMMTTPAADRQAALSTGTPEWLSPKLGIVSVYCSICLTHLVPAVSTSIACETPLHRWHPWMSKHVTCLSSLSRLDPTTNLSPGQRE